MAVTMLNRVTLSAAITADQSQRIQMSSTASIAVGDLLAIRGTKGLEVARVQEIPISGFVNAVRGVLGTAAVPANSGTAVYTGTPAQFQFLKGSAVALIGNSGTLPDYLIPGARAFDGQGNEYILLELTETVVPGAGVFISRDNLYTASVMTAVGQGPVAIIVENSTSDQYAWGQIGGFYDHVKLVGGSSLLTSLGEFQAASSVSTPSVGVLGRSSSQRSSDYGAAATIYGMYANAAASTASTSASSETGYFSSCFLDHPYVIRVVTS